MKSDHLSILLLLLSLGSCFSKDAPYKFPDYFQFGSASSSYQIEGAWNVDGKGVSIWDTATHRQPNYVADASTGDDAAKSYLYYKEDVAALKEIGMKFYRFSITWTRILPNGDFSVIRQEGLQYYDNLIDELLANDIEPMVTMYHWDLPQRLQDLGGWANNLTINHLVEFSQLLFDRYASKVKKWITFNEPLTFCEGGYGDPWGAPFIRSSGIGGYLCGHNVLIAHAKVYHLYREKYFSRFRGQIGISIKCDYAWPKDAENPGDVAAADRALQFSCGWFGHPIFSAAGGYPDVMISFIDRKSKEEGRAWSRLPKMSDELRSYIRGTADFWGMNYYTGTYANQPPNFGEPSKYASYWFDQEATLTANVSWPRAKSVWLYSVPEGLRSLLNWIKTEYRNPDIIITENGWSDDGELDDVGRIKYLSDHFNVILQAIFEDGCNVIGHTTWSLIDNFEWMMGYTEKFGIYHVDFEDPERKRTAKNSSKILKEIIQSRKVPQEQ